MRILAILQGNYGKRIVKTLAAYMPAGWKLDVHVFPEPLPVVDEDSLVDLLPDKLPKTDLLLSLSENSCVSELLPEMAELSGAKTVLAPVANRSWFPPGLANQVKRRLTKKGIAFAMPLPFCMLTEETSGDPLVKEFARHFGYPEVKVEHEQEKVKKVEVLKDAPCGNTRFVAKKLIGTNTKDAYFEAGLLHHAHVCYATMVMDREFGDTLMHRSGLAVKKAVGDAVGSK